MGKTVDTEKIDEMGKRLENIMGEAMKKVAPQLEGMAKELQKIVRPKSKKNIKFNGSNVAISLIEDGRVMITCSTLDEAQEIYDNDFENKNEINRLNLLVKEQKNAMIFGQEKMQLCLERLDMVITEAGAWKKRATENESKWWYKFFNYFTK